MQHSADRRHVALRAPIACVALVALAACGSISPERMVPAEAAGGPDRNIALRVKVAGATGPRATHFGGPAFPTAQQYQQVLVATLVKARIFAAVAIDDGDVDLTMTLLSLDQQGMIPFTTRMVANYRFVSRDGATLWSETYDSSFSATDFAGATRTLNANEGAVRENLKALVQGLRERWPP